MNIEEKTSFFPELFEKMLLGKASEIEMNSMADLYSEHGIAVLTLSEEQLSKFQILKGSRHHSQMLSSGVDMVLPINPYFPIHWRVNLELKAQSLFQAP